MNKFDKTFEFGQVLKASEMNDIVTNINLSAETDSLTQNDIDTLCPSLNSNLKTK